MNANLKNQIISEIQLIVKEHNLSVITKSLFIKYSNISEKQVYKAFGTWNAAVEASGLKPNNNTKKKTNDELFDELLRVCEKIRKIPTTLEFNRISSSDSTVYTKRRFGSWDNTLLEFKNWLIEKYPSSELIELIKDSKISSNETLLDNNNEQKNNEFVRRRKKGTVYGAPLDFKGLRHEPVNEQGVVFLFGKINEELGIIVEAVKTGFPDCEGKRLVDSNRKLWESVSIEFEYKSKNFLEHGHDPNGCDVIVCWIHDWLDCPLEIIELKSIINAKLNR